MARSFPPPPQPQDPPNADRGVTDTEGTSNAAHPDDCAFDVDSSNRIPTEEIPVGPSALADDPCSCVLRGDQEALVRYLRRGGSPDARCDEGFTMLDLAAARANVEAVGALLAAGAQVGTLHAAVGGGSAEVVRALLDAGAPVDGRDRAGFTPLHQAVCQGDAPLVALLLSRGADATAELHDTGALALARRGREPRIVGLLRQKGARR